VIDRLSRRHPRIVIQVVLETGAGRAQRRNLSERRVDLLIYRRFAYLSDPQLSFEKLFESPYLVAAGNGNPWVKRRRVALAGLMEDLWALPPPDDSFGPFVLEAFRAAGLHYPPASVLGAGHDLRISLLRTNRYLSILPEFLLRFPTEHAFIKKLPVELPIASAPIGIIMLKNRKPSPVMQRFIDCARKVAKPLAVTKR